MLKNQNNNKPFFMKKPAPTNQYGSPRFARKKNDQTSTYFARKTTSKGQGSERVCYISPKKVLDHFQGGCSSYNSLSSTPTTSTTNKIEPKVNKLSQDYSYSSINLSAKNKISSVNPSASEIVAKTKSISQENYELKKNNQQLQQKLKQKTLQLQEAYNINKQLTQKISEMKDLLENKTMLIIKLQQHEKETQSTIQRLTESLKNQKDQSAGLAILIQNIQKSNQQCFSSQTISSISGQTEDDEKQRLEKEIQKYRSQAIILNSKLKYSSIQESMYQKIRFDLKSETQKNQRLKVQNRKLLAKVEALVKQAEKRALPRWKTTTPRSLKDSQISLELSPEKQ